MMKFVMKKYGIQIIPENEQDEAYIEDTLKLRREGDSLPLTRVAYYGLPNSLAHLEAVPEDKK